MTFHFDKVQFIYSVYINKVTIMLFHWMWYCMKEMGGEGVGREWDDYVRQVGKREDVQKRVDTNRKMLLKASCLIHNPVQPRI